MTARSLGPAALACVRLTMMLPFKVPGRAATAPPGTYGSLPGSWQAEPAEERQPASRCLAPQVRVPQCRFPHDHEIGSAAQVRRDAGSDKLESKPNRQRQRRALTGGGDPEVKGPRRHLELRRDLARDGERSNGGVLPLGEDPDILGRLTRTQLGRVEADLEGGLLTWRERQGKGLVSQCSPCAAA